MGVYPFADVIHEVCADNMGGLSVDVWFAPVTYITAFPGYENKDSIEVAGKIELKENAKFVQITA